MSTIYTIMFTRSNDDPDNFFSESEIWRSFSSREKAVEYIKEHVAGTHSAFVDEKLGYANFISICCNNCNDKRTQYRCELDIVENELDEK